MHRCARKCLNQRRCANAAPEDDSFARKVTTDSRINIGIVATAVQKWDVSVFVLSTERPCDWGDLAGVGATAARPLVGEGKLTRKRFGLKTL